MIDKVHPVDKLLSLPCRQLLALVRLAISGKIHPVLEECKIDWNAIYQLAEKHTIIGIGFKGIEALSSYPLKGESQMPVIRQMVNWLGQSEYIKIQNEVIEERCIEVRKLFAENGFRTSIMKGQGNANLYKAHSHSLTEEESTLSQLRNSGDIDLWVEGSFEKINAFVQKLAPTDEINELEIQFNLYDDVPVEVHYRPFFMRNPWKNKRLQEYLNEEAENCFGSESGFTTLRFKRIHQLVHIHLHLLTEGIGLRQIIDYYFVLRSSSTDSMWLQQKAETMQVAKDLGLSRFTAALMYILHECLGLEEECLLCAPCEKDGLILLQEIMASGNFGHQDERNSLIKRIAILRVFWIICLRNLRLWRFDHWDWFWGPLWRAYHRLWRVTKGYA